MNIVKISGDVGEQMFQYAFFLRLLKNHPKTLIHLSDDRIIKMFPNLPFKPVATREQVYTVHKSLLGRLSGTKRTGQDY